jgi:hypothetical protein
MVSVEGPDCAPPLIHKTTVQELTDNTLYIAYCSVSQPVVRDDGTGGPQADLN